MANKSYKKLVTFKPEPGDLFNVIISLQYHTTPRWRADFNVLSFSSTAGVQDAIQFLDLDDALLRMRLPKLKDPDCVFRSSFDYDYTIEILFPDCEAGQPSEAVFHTFYQQFSVDPRALEHLHIQSVWVYFLPRNMTKLDRSCYAPYVLNRPKNSWKFWRPERHPERNAFFHQRSKDVQSSVWGPSPGPSRWRQDTPYTTSPDGDDPSSMPLQHRSPSQAPATSIQDDRNSVAHPNMTAAGDLQLEVPIPLTDPSSISSAIQSLSKLVPSAQSVIAGPSSLSPVQTPYTPEPRAPNPDPHDISLDDLRAQLQQSTTQSDLQRKRIREFQQELTAERDARSRSEAQLEEERRLLEEERRRLEDLQQECKAPCLVPALVDALLGVTAMSHDTPP